QRVHRPHHAQAEVEQADRVQPAERRRRELARGDVADEDRVDHAHKHHAHLHGDDRHREPHERAHVVRTGDEGLEHPWRIAQRPDSRQWSMTSPLAAAFRAHARGPLVFARLSSRVSDGDCECTASGRSPTSSLDSCLRIDVHAITSPIDGNLTGRAWTRVASVDDLRHARAEHSTGVASMRPAVAVPVLLAACLVASVAVAQNDKISAQFEALAASGVTGEVTLNPMPNGEIQLRSQVKGLAPETEYQVFVYDASATCGSGTPVQIVTFTSNKNGIATWNTRTSVPLTSVQSIGIQQEPSNTLVACAAVPQ